ncbi:MAG: phosphatase PAP2 family protein [Oscillospiraceae bacterium]|nr:phosphatase PAP2 family protein [Oscillospiraceae bacterium]
MGLDHAVLRFFQDNVQDGALTAFFRFVSFLADGGWLWIAVSVALLCFRSTRKAGVASAVALLCSLLFTNILLKNVIARPRPYVAYGDLRVYAKELSSFSFPSGHASASFAASAAIFWFHKLPGVGALALAAVIAFSRVYLSVHYLTDVLGGAALGVLYAAAGAFAARRFYKRAA